MADTRDPQTYAILGACLEVHKDLGYGFLNPCIRRRLSGS